MNNIQHENSDSLLLLAIIYASDYGKKHVNLPQIIGACDFIEHVIITYDELNGGLVRLINNKHIEVLENLLFKPLNEISQKFNKQKNLKKKNNVRQDLEFIRSLIKAKEWENNIDLMEINKDFDLTGLTYDIYRSSCMTYLNA